MSLVESRNTVPFRPLTPSYFGVENALNAKGADAGIRYYGWKEPSSGAFFTPLNCIDFSLTKRSNVSLKATGEQTFTTPGDIVFIPSRTLFDTFTGPSDNRSLCLTFDDEKFEAIAEEIEGAVDLRYCLDVRAPLVRQYLIRIVQEVNCPSFASGTLIEALTLAILVELCRSEGLNEDFATRRVGKMPDWRMNRVLDFIQANLANQIAISDAAVECGIGARHLMRTFKFTLGISISDYIAQERIARAENALANGKKLVKQICADCGFSNAAAFSTAFRRVTGLTPQQYRQQATHRKRSDIPSEAIAASNNRHDGHLNRQCVKPR